MVKIKRFVPLIIITVIALLAIAGYFIYRYTYKLKNNVKGLETSATSQVEGESDLNISIVEANWEKVTSKHFNISFIKPKSATISQVWGKDSDFPEATISKLDFTVPETESNIKFSLVGGIKPSDLDPSKLVETKINRLKKEGNKDCPNSEIPVMTINNFTGYQLIFDCASRGKGSTNYYLISLNGNSWMDLEYRYPATGTNLVGNEEAFAEKILSSVLLLEKK